MIGVLLVSLAFFGGSVAESWAPTTLDFSDLAAGRVAETLERALTAEGLVQVVGIPEFARLRAGALRAAHGCVAVSPRAASHVFGDGTARRSLATAGAGRALGAIAHESSAAPCDELAGRGGEGFRLAVSRAVDVVVAQLDAILGLGRAAPMLQAAGGGYHTLEEVVASGERLEHFHSYESAAAGPAGPEPTLDFHVDQGLFIAFVPAMMLGGQGGEGEDAPAGNFLLRLEGGREVEAELRSDSVVFLLGDGVNQYVNRAHRRSPLRAPSHAFRMPQDARSQQRVWYGMMQLPPPDAVSEEDGMTFGAIREELIRASASGEEAAVPGIGCARKLTARELSGASCAADQMHCWMRCMNYTAEVSPDACKAKGQELVCADPEGALFQGKHGNHNYEPRCWDPAYRNMSTPSTTMGATTSATTSTPLEATSHAQALKHGALLLAVIAAACDPQ